jgi:glycosyltransferase involved in cell wall biosynthesis
MASLVFSIIIPTYNRPQQLGACLESLSQLDYPRQDFEVIVVDDGSEIPPGNVCYAFRERFKIELIEQAHAGPAAARNAGSLRARGEFLVFTDDDCRARSDWLRQIAVHCRATPEHIIGGRTINLLQDNYFSRTSQLIVDAVYDYYNLGVNGPLFFASNNLVVPVASFHRVGGFNSEFTTAEDRDLCDRWLAQGYRMTYAPEALVYHAHSLNLRTFYRQHLNYGRGAFRFHRARAQRGSGPFKPDLKFYFHCFRAPFTNGQRHPAVLPLLVIWQIANTAGFVVEWMAQKSAKRQTGEAA